MQQVTARIGVAIAVLTVAAAAAPRALQQNPGSQVNVDEFRSKPEPLGVNVKPAIKLLIGTWKFNPEASRFENVFAPKDATRTYRDLGNGSYGCTQVVEALEGGTSETRYVGKDDGTESELSRVGADGKLVPSGTLISFRWVNDHAAEQTEVNHGVVTTSRREISPDGKTMTVTLPTHAFYYVSPHVDDPVPDLIIFDKQ